MWAPRPTPPRTVIWIEERHADGPFEIGHLPAVYELEVLPGDAVGGRLAIEILSDPYLPAEDGAVDSRELGVVLSEIGFQPR
jgi:hypothetical protein